MSAPEAPAAATSYTPFVTDLVRLVRVLFSPSSVFEEQRDKPTVWGPFLVIALLAVVIGVVLMKPYTIRMMELATQGSGREMPPAAAQIGLAIALITTPVIFLALAALNAGLMWLWLQMSGGEVRYKGLMSASMFSMAVGVIQLVANWAVLTARGGAEALEGPQDMSVGLGLNLLLSPDTGLPKFVQGVLAGIGPLQVWGLIITVYGVSVLEKKKLGAAWTAAIAAYVVLMLIGAVFYGRGGGS